MLIFELPVFFLRILPAISLIFVAKGAQTIPPGESPLKSSNYPTNMTFQRTVLAKNCEQSKEELDLQDLFKHHFPSPQGF